jgi:hypothetical protein
MKVDYFSDLIVPDVPGLSTATGDGVKSSVARVSPVSPVKKTMELMTPVFITTLAPVQAIPEICQDCTRLEIIADVGVGCVRVLPESSPWREEWRRIPTDLRACKWTIH